MYEQTQIPTLKRRVRRNATKKICQKRWDFDYSTFSPTDIFISGYNRIEPHGYHKYRPLSCNCRKKKKGNPKVWAGMCTVNETDRVYSWRRENRKLHSLVRLAVGIDWNGDEVSTLFSPSQLYW